MCFVLKNKIKFARLRCFVHFERMPAEITFKRAYMGHPIGRRPVSRPKYLRKNKVEEDLWALYAENWADIAQDRARWHQLMSEAKTHSVSIIKRYDDVNVLLTLHGNKIIHSLYLERENTYHTELGYCYKNNVSLPENM